MIVLTGYGRSGTSVLALIYQELGFDLGGTWQESVDAGLEDEAVWRVNDQIASRLRTAIPGAYHRTRIRRDLTFLLRKARLLRSEDRLYLLPPARGFTHYRTAEVDRIVADLGPEMRRVAAERIVVKDPRMLWTLGVWLGSGAKIDAVVIAVRDIDEVIASRRRASGIRWPPAGVRAATAHGLVRCIDAVARHQVPLSVVRYPDLLADPRALHAALPFPDPIPFEQFERAVGVVRR
jgi:hypothetical protein